MGDIKVTRNYSFWQHPFRWWFDRNKIVLLEAYVNYQWEHGLREEVAEVSMDALLYGSGIMKDGKRIDPTKFAPKPPLKTN